MTIDISFSGFFECRLATDPDPFDDRRGISGWTFALPNESNLDRVIRFQPAGTVSRWGGPPVGVAVRRVSVDGAYKPAHPLIGAPVMLHGDPVFEGRNGLIADPAQEPLFPFEISIGSGGFLCQRAMLDGAGAPELLLAAGSSMRPDLLQQAGISDPVQYRARRRQEILARMETETESATKAGLEKRKQWLDRPNPRNALMWGPAHASLFVEYDYALKAPAGIIRDPAGVLPPIDAAAAWRALFSCGAWDADALAGYVDGKLVLPRAEGIA